MASNSSMIFLSSSLGEAMAGRPSYQYGSMVMLAVCGTQGRTRKVDRSGTVQWSSKATSSAYPVPVGTMDWMSSPRSPP